jgi:DNA-binding LacI/PurR family transcriptional regulator
MNKTERQHQIVQLIEQADGEHVLATRDLAERFGVSEMTVRRDLQALEHGGYVRRQHGGAAPVQHRTEQGRKEIGIILASKSGKFEDPFFNAVLEGVDRKLQELGYRIAYINTRAQVSTAAQLRDLLRSNAVSGVILVSMPLVAESLEYLKTESGALVSIIDSVGSDYDTITFDGHSGIRQMVAHLVMRGYRRLGFITGHYDSRQQGFLDAIKAHSLPTDPDLMITVPFGIDGWTPDLGHIGAQHLMGLSHPPDAIVCASDRLAIGAIQWLHQHNLRVPDDVAVTGFDTLNESAFTTPSLTTVHVHKQLMGELAAERIVKRIENEDEVPLFIQTPTRLVIRQSCGSGGQS